MEKQNKMKSKSQKWAKKSDKTKNVKNIFSARKGSRKIQHNLPGQETCTFYLKKVYSFLTL